MSIRYAIIDDLPQLLEIEEQAFTCDLIDEHHFKGFLKSNGTSCHLLVSIHEEIPDGVIGYILILTPRNRTNAVIHSFAVDQFSRGSGTGAALIDYACQITKQIGKPNIMTHVRVDSPFAIARYKKSGFHIIGAEANYYEDGCDSVKYLRKL